MIKKHFPLLIFTSVVILIPMLIGLLLWNRLPEQIAIHWNAQGVADGFGSKAFAVFVMPAGLLGVHWLCTLLTAVDPKKKDIEGKPFALVLWICPILSLSVELMVYAAALGYPISVERIMPLVFGALFVAIGNYLPKCKQNYSIGIKVPWTLNDEENWNKTHRFAGIVWAVGGVVAAVTSFIGSFVIWMSVTIVMVIVPVVYSYCLYRKKNTENDQ